MARNFELLFVSLGHFGRFVTLQVTALKKDIEQWLDGTVPPLDTDVHLEEIAYNPCCDCFTGADLSALVREASVCALKQQMTMFSPANKNPFTGEIRVGKKHFEESFKKVKSSITPKT
ncbi:hypothetical protein E2320_018739 [Naja naja]|nr:hypothetical protein E2320_018739 [Naja naja]